MVHESDHDTCVRAWLERSAGASSSNHPLEALEHAFAVMWRRAHLTLGKVTLNAIAGRALHSTGRKFPMLSPLMLDEQGLRCQDVIRGSPDGGELENAVHSLLVEFLTVLGTLTGEILTPALHDELSKLAP